MDQWHHRVENESPFEGCYTIILHIDRLIYNISINNNATKYVGFTEQRHFGFFLCNLETFKKVGSTENGALLLTQIHVAFSLLPQILSGQNPCSRLL